MMELKDLGCVEPWGGYLSEPHHQHRSNGEVRHHDAIARREGRPESGQVVAVETAGADYRVDAGIGEDGEVGSTGVDHGEVDHHLGAGLHHLGRPGNHDDPVGDPVKVLPHRGGVGGSHQDEAVGAVDRPTGGATHTAGRAQHTDSDRSTRFHAGEASGRGNHPRPGLWPEPPVAAPVAEIGSAAPPAATTRAFVLGGNSQVAMNSLQLGLKGILE